MWGVRTNGRVFAVPPNVCPLWPLMNWQQAAHWAAFHDARPYVYAITYPSGMPFYIGKGSGKRILQHAAFLRLTDLWPTVRKPQSEKEAILWQLAINREYERYSILAICESEEHAYSFEAVAIQTYGQRARGDGILCNSTQMVETPYWPMPEAPMIDEVVSDGHFPWHFAPENNPRSPEGLVVWCPRCQNPGKITRQKPVRDLQCPSCFHYFEFVPEKKLRPWIPEGFTQDCKEASE